MLLLGVIMIFLTGLAVYVIMKPVWETIRDGKHSFLKVSVGKRENSKKPMNLTEAPYEE